MFRVFGLATRDYLHEWQMSVCFVLGLAAVLGPMMVLFGLKFGIVGAMMQELIEDPGNREIRPVGSGRYDNAWLDNVRARPDVAFLVPRTRSIAATIELSSEQSSRIVPVELIASGDGDPLLAPGEPLPAGLDRIVLSTGAADKLGVKAGDAIDGSLVRRYRGKQERVHLDLKVATVAPPRAFSRDGAFVSVQLLEALEDFRDGRAVPDLGWSGAPANTGRTYTGFRLYARSIDDVAGLGEAFVEIGVDVHTQEAGIELVQRMDRNLSAIYWAIAVIGLVGFSLSLGANLWANGLGAGGMPLFCHSHGDQQHDGRTGGSGTAGLPLVAVPLWYRAGTDLRCRYHRGRTGGVARGTRGAIRGSARTLNAGGLRGIIKAYHRAAVHKRCHDAVQGIHRQPDAGSLPGRHGTLPAGAVVRRSGGVGRCP